jgi:hypothetical protein
VINTVINKVDKQDKWYEGYALKGRLIPPWWGDLQKN